MSGTRVLTHEGRNGGRFDERMTGKTFTGVVRGWGQGSVRRWSPSPEFGEGRTRGGCADTVGPSPSTLLPILTT